MEPINDDKVIAGIKSKIDRIIGKVSDRLISEWGEYGKEQKCAAVVVQQSEEEYIVKLIPAGALILILKALSFPMSDNLEKGILDEGQEGGPHRLSVYFNFGDSAVVAQYARIDTPINKGYSFIKGDCGEEIAEMIDRALEITWETLSDDWDKYDKSEKCSAIVIENDSGEYTFFLAPVEILIDELNRIGASVPLGLEDFLRDKASGGGPHRLSVYFRFPQNFVFVNLRRVKVSMRPGLSGVLN
jgi:hypothetical protein